MTTISALTTALLLSQFLLQHNRSYLRSLRKRCIFQEKYTPLPEKSTIKRRPLDNESLLTSATMPRCKPLPRNRVMKNRLPDLESDLFLSCQELYRDKNCFRPKFVLRYSRYWNKALNNSFTPPLFLLRCCTKTIHNNRVTKRYPILTRCCTESGLQGSRKLRHPFSESLYYQNGTLACPDYDHSNVSVGDTHTLKKIYDTAIRIDICWAHLYSKMLSRGDNCLSTGDYCHLKYSLFLQCRPLPEIKQYSLLFGKRSPCFGAYCLTARFVLLDNNISMLALTLFRGKCSML